MRRILLIVFTTFVLNAFGQTDPLNSGIAGHSNKSWNVESDTIPQVLVVNPGNTGPTPAFYINAKQVNGKILKTLNPMHIESINVVKHDIKIEETKYNGQIYIQLKPDYRPEIVSLSDIKSKYTSLAKDSSIFMIDNEVISGDYRQYMVDEKYILKIVVQRIVNKEEDQPINVIRLLTRTEENIKKSKEVFLRGTEDLKQDN